MDEFIKHKKVKKRYFIFPIPFVLLLMDFLIFKQKGYILDEKTMFEAIKNIVIIAFCSGSVVLSLIYFALKISKIESDSRREKQYLDGIVRKFFVPLNSIIGLCSDCNENVDKSKNLELKTQLLLETSLRMKKSLQDIDEYNMLLNKKLKLELFNINLRELFDNVIEYLIKIKPNTCVIFKNNVTNDIIVKVDARQAQKIISNIMISLLNFTESGTISFTAEKRLFDVKIKIVDDGVTFKDNIKDNLFEPYEGANNISNLHYTGTGLSLAIASELTKLHHGKVWIDKKNDNEAVLYLTFLRGKNIVIPTKYSEDSANYFRDTGRRIDSLVHINEAVKGKILLIKGVSVHKEILMNMLFDEKYDIFAPIDPLFNYDSVELDKEYDLIIIDEMYEFSNFDLCKQMRNKYELSQMPILLMVPNDRQANLKKAYDVGANDCIDYLVLKQQLIAKVNTLVQIKKATENLVNSQVSLLQAQIQPHFLYNALNTIAQLCLDEPIKAYETLIDFSQYLRSKFSFKNPHRAVTIEDEVSTVKSYLNIEKARFGERLSYKIIYNGEGQRFIPSLIIQPFVENSVKHGVSKNDKGGNILVEIFENDETTKVSISDDGQGMNKKTLDEIINGDPTKLGTGISNGIKRLKIYNSNNFSISSTLGEGTKISFDIPINWYMKFKEN